MDTPLANLIALLDLEELEVNVFRGVSPKEDRQPVFGGQVAARRAAPDSRGAAPANRSNHG